MRAEPCARSDALPGGRRAAAPAAAGSGSRPHLPVASSALSKDKDMRVSLRPDQARLSAFFNKYDCSLVPPQCHSHVAVC